MNNGIYMGSPSKSAQNTRDSMQYQILQFIMSIFKNILLKTYQGTCLLFYFALIRI